MKCEECLNNKKDVRFEGSEEAYLCDSCLFNRTNYTKMKGEN